MGNELKLPEWNRVYPGSDVSLAQECKDFWKDGVTVWDVREEMSRRHGIKWPEVPHRSRSHRGRRCWVYFVLAPEQSLVKIGISVNPNSRINDFESKWPIELVLLGSISGGRALEKKLHRELEAHAKGNEWFEYNDEVKAAINNLLEMELTP